MADLADLSNLQDGRFTHLQQGSERQRTKIKSFSGQVFREIPGSHIKTRSTHFLDALQGQQTDLTMPVSAMPITFHPESRNQYALPYVLFALPLAGAGAYGDQFSLLHEMLL
jgi:hypothetical protein